MKPFNSTLPSRNILPTKAFANSLLQHTMLVLSAFCIIAMFYVSSMLKTANQGIVDVLPHPAGKSQKPFSASGAGGTHKSQSVTTLVADALAFKAMLNSTQQASLQLTYTTTLARKWSNLPCGTSCRNGVQIGNLPGATYQAAMQVTRDALSAAYAENGWDEYHSIAMAEAYLHANSTNANYDSTFRWMAYLGTPSDTGPWMLQFGGHHYAANIAFNNGHVIGATPFFMGTEPKAFTYNGTSYAPLNSERDAFSNMLASLSSTELAAAKLTQSFNDCYMIPGETNNHNYTGFPATKAGISCNNLTQSQKDLVLAVIENYTGDMDSATHATQQAIYASEINDTYIAWVGTGTAGSASTFLVNQGNYARLDGPHVWAEFFVSAQSVISGALHYHTVWRDHVHDYGQDLSGPAIDTTMLTPLKLISFTANIGNKIPILRWVTVNELNVSHFEIEQSSNPSKDFRRLGIVRAKNTTAENLYSYTLTTPLPAATTFFRLKMADLDGKVTYSKVVALRGGSGKLNLVNTFVTDELIISHLPAENVYYKISNLQGQVVAKGRLQKGSNTSGVNVSLLQSGQYVISVETESDKLSAKFLKH